MQEVDRFEDFEEDLKMRGYSGIWKVNAVSGVNVSVWEFSNLFVCF